MEHYVDYTKETRLHLALSGNDLIDAHAFDLKSLLNTCPALFDTLIAKADGGFIVTTGAILSQLLDESLHDCPTCIVLSPGTRKSDIVEFSRSEFFPFYCQTANNRMPLVGFDISKKTVCVEAHHAQTFFEDAYSHGSLLFAFVLEDHIAIRYLRIDDGFIDNYRAVAHAYNAETYFGYDLLGSTASAFPEVKFHETSSFCSNRFGQRAHLIEVSYLDDVRVGVSLDGLPITNILKLGNIFPLLSTVKQRLVDANYYRGEPVLALLRASDIPDAVPAYCEAIPIVTIFLPPELDTQASDIATGEVWPNASIGFDFSFCKTNLAFGTSKNVLDIAASAILDELLERVATAGGMIVIVCCKDKGLLRYIKADAWLQKYFKEDANNQLFQPPKEWDTTRINNCECSMCRGDDSYSGSSVPDGIILGHEKCEYRCPNMWAMQKSPSGQLFYQAFIYKMCDISDRDGEISF